MIAPTSLHRIPWNITLWFTCLCLPISASTCLTCQNWNTSSQIDSLHKNLACLIYWIEAAILPSWREFWWIYFLGLDSNQFNWKSILDMGLGKNLRLAHFPNVFQLQSHIIEHSYLNSLWPHGANIISMIHASWLKKLCPLSNMLNRKKQYQPKLISNLYSYTHVSSEQVCNL